MSTQGCFIKCPATSTGSFQLPEGIWKIADYAFYECSSLTEILIHPVSNSYLRVGSGAFFLCSQLETMSLPRTWFSGIDAAFYGCSNLKEISMERGSSSYSINDFARCDSLICIKYSGTIAEFNKGKGWTSNYNRAAKIKVLCTDGTTYLE